MKVHQLIGLENHILLEVSFVVLVSRLMVGEVWLVVFEKNY
jgi:hypothetical protein